MNFLAAPLAIVAAAFPAGAQGATGTGWHPPIVLPARPLLDGPTAVRPALAADRTGVAALAFVADTTHGARMAVGLRPPGGGAFLTPRTLPGRPDLNDAGGRAPTLAAGPGGRFAVAWLAAGRGAKRTPGVVVSIRRPGHAFGLPHQVSHTGARPLAAPPAVAIDARGTTTVAWAEQREHSRRVVVVRVAPGRLPTRAHQLAAGSRIGPPGAADGAVAWAQGGRLRLAARPGARFVADLGPAVNDRAPALASTAGRLAAVWHARVGGDGVLLLRDPAGAVTRLRLDGPLSAGPQIGLDMAGQATVAWQDARGVIAITAGGRAQILGSSADAATLGGVSVAPTGRAIVTFLGDDDREGEQSRPEAVKVSARPPGGAFLTATTLSKHAPFVSLAAGTVVPGGAELVTWATSIGAPGAGLLHLATRERGAAAASAAAAPAAPVAEPGLIA